MHRQPLRVPTSVKLLAAAALALPALAAQTWYVNQQAPAGGDGRAWATAFNTLPPALAAAQPTDQVWVAAGVYVGNFALPAEVALYGGFTGAETELAQRNWSIHRTILDGDASGTVVTVATGATAATRLDGFVIRNGSGTLTGGFTRGGGIYWLDASPTVINNTIMNNAAEGGGGIYCSGAPLFVNNVLVGNGAGGVVCAGTPLLVNNTIAGNSGAGFTFGFRDSPTVVNNLIAFNRSGVSRVGWGQFGSPVFRHNCVAANGSNFPNSPDPTGTDGNIAVDPLLADAAYGNLHLQPDSPCRDAGDDTAVQPGWLDRDGQPRVLDAHVDIGADESNGTAWPAGPYAVVRVSPTGDDAQDGTTWALAKRTVQSAIGVAAELGGEVWVRVGEYPEHLILQPFAYVYGGFAGTESVRDERDWACHEATLVGTTAAPVVSVYAGWNVTTLDGFTVRDGGGDGVYCRTETKVANNTIRGHSGHGVVCESASPELHDNIIAQNGGDGLRALSADTALITDNVIRENGGAGIQVTYSYSPSITGNVVTANSEHGIQATGLTWDWHDTPVMQANQITLNGSGGIYCWGADATIAANLIQGNGGYDGGIYCYESAPTIAGNTIVGNHGGEAGGIHCEQFSAAVIRGNWIAFNTGGLGGGIACEYATSAYIAHNQIRCNHGGAGGGIVSKSTDSLTVINNVIAGNSAYDCGGIYFAYGDNALLANNTLLGNGGAGGGIFVAGGAPTIVNSLIAFNSSGIRRETAGALDLSYNCVFGNTHGDYVEVADPTGTNGNVSINPQLADFAHGNAHLQPGSPCVDAGTSDVLQPDWLDIDQQPRLSGAGVDIGADEADGTLWASGPYAVIRVSATGDDACDGASWATAKRTVQAGIDAAAEIGADVWVQAGTYLETVTLRPYAHVYGGFAGFETERAQRDWRTNPTILDADRAGSVVRVLAGEAASRLDGLTLRNGTGSRYHFNSELSGGGIHCICASPHVANVTISGNQADNGAGVYCACSAAQIVNCRIVGNRASVGGAVYVVSAYPTLAGCVLVGNSALDGSGIWVERIFVDPPPVLISGCSVVAHTGYARAVYFDMPAVLADTVVAYNGVGIGARATTPIDLRYNCVYGNANGNYASGTPDPTGTAGNISADPLFVRLPSDGGDGWGDDPNTPDLDEGANDDYGDLRLRPGSPCIDAGDNAAVAADVWDLDADGDTGEALPLDLADGARFADDPFTADTGSGTAPLVDIGACELQVLPGDLNCDGFVDFRDINRFVLILTDPVAYAAAYPACPPANADINGDGSIDFADINPFVQCLTGGCP